MTRRATPNPEVDRLSDVTAAASARGAGGMVRPLEGVRSWGPRPARLHREDRVNRRWIVALVAAVAFCLSVPAWAVRLGRFDRYVIGINGAPVSGASVEVRRQGAWSAQVGTQAGDTGDGADTIQVVHKGQIQTGDTVVIDTGSVGYTVGTVTTTTIQLTAGGVFSIPAGTRLSPTNNKPTLYVDNQGVTTKANPFTTSSKGQAECWLADGFYDYKISGGGVVTFLVYDYMIGGVQKDEANTWSAAQTFGAGITLPSVTVAPGNLVSVDGNDTDLTPNPTCANSGTAGMLTILDSDETATDSFRVCVGVSDHFVFPNVGADVAAAGEVLTGTGAGTAAWQAFPAGTLNVNEADASPSVATVGTIKVLNGGLVDETGGVVRLQGFGLRPPFQSGKWYDCGNVCGIPHATATSLVDTTLTIDQILYVPFFVGYRQTFTHFGFPVDNTTPNGNAKVAVYSMGTNGQPNARLAADTVVPVVTGAEASVESDIADITLDPGWYFLAIIPDAALVIKALPTDSAQGVLGFTDTLNLSNGNTWVMFHQNGQTYAGGLPANAGGIAFSNTPRALRLMLKAQ